MSKQRHVEDEIKYCIIIAIISAIIFPVMVIIMSNNIIPTFVQQNKIIFAIYMLFIVLSIFISGMALIVTVEYIIIYKHIAYIKRKQYERSLIEIQKLTNEFSEVKICDSEQVNILDVLPYDAIKCMAKRDENNNITYRVQIDFEKTTDDYVGFVDNFEI